MMPAWDQIGVPIHFHSSTTSGSASWMIPRTFASVLPRQSPSSLIRSSISAEADSAGLDFLATRSSCLLSGGLDPELLRVLGVQALPAAELHRIARDDAPD